ncbi:hypothetical protein ACFQJ7_14735 [Halovenus rubra]|uniref:Transcriptional regulator n=2 Tax=Halovenus rubra TaxID=869890 RepID=A0ABD5XBH1_9EURY|nr:hypothetical protein [Halovenus rubra]
MAERAGRDNNIDLSELDNASNVLLLVPSLGNQGREASLTLLTRTPPGETNVLSVTYTDTAQEWVDFWDDFVNTEPIRGGVVDIGQQDGGVDDPVWAVKTVENPSDLTGIGIELSELLQTMARAAPDSEEIAFSFDSITSLLQYADLQRAFRFLHVVTGRVKTVDGTGYYRIDPDAHDRQTLATLKGLFDAVVDVDEDDNWEIQQ